MLHRTALIIFAFSLMAGTGNVLADQVVDAMKECAANTDSAKRLACFDALLEKDDKEAPSPPEVSSTPAVPSAPAVSNTPAVSSTPAVPSVPEEPAKRAEPEIPEIPEINEAVTPSDVRGANSTASVENFGIEQQRAIEDALESLESRAVEVAHARFRRTKITLENGQIWEQTDGKRMSLKAGQLAVITRGTFNSFFIQAKDGGTRVRVRRIK